MICSVVLISVFYLKKYRTKHKASPPLQILGAGHVPLSTHGSTPIIRLDHIVTGSQDCTAISRAGVR